MQQELRILDGSKLSLPITKGQDVSCFRRTCQLFINKFFSVSDYDMRMFANYYEYIVLKAEFNEDGHVETICTTSPTDRLYFFKFKPSSESPTGWTSYLAK